MTNDKRQAKGTKNRPTIFLYIEHLKVVPHGVSIRGWLFHEKKEVKRLILIIKWRDFEKSRKLKYPETRDDVAARFELEAARRSGFSRDIELPLKGDVTIDLKVEFTDGSLDLIKLGRYSSTPQLHGFKFLKSLKLRHLRAALLYLKRGELKFLLTALKNRWSSREVGSLDPNLSELLSGFFSEPPEFAPLKLRKPIDLILPVFNGYEYVKTLIPNIRANTRIPYRLIVIDDASTDSRLIKYLDGISSAETGIELLRNKNNVGFVKSVNQGVKIVDNHFVVLNSDIEVPDGWLARLMKPILHWERVASTTPFTNSGILCSFPEFLKDNLLLEGKSVADIDRAFRQVNPEKNQVELPTGVGFCMGINKKVVDRLGFFDEKTFGKGYGEENDWSMRAREHGYKNMIVPNLFVYHKHKGSFSGEEKKRLKDSNLIKLLNRYPDYSGIVDEFVNRDPLAGIRRVVQILLRAADPDQKSLLVFDHQLGGGAGNFRENWVNNRLSEGRSVFVLTAKPGGYLLTFFNGLSRLKLSLNNVSEIDELFHFVQIDQLWVNHLLNFENTPVVLMQIRRIKSTRGISLRFFVHDYFCICPSYVLLNDRSNFCGIPSLEVCPPCLKNNRSTYIQTPYHEPGIWRREWLKTLKLADEIICFSNSSKELLLMAYPALQDSIIRIKPHSVEDLSAVEQNRGDNSTLNIGVLGIIHPQKGSLIVKKMAGNIKKQGRRDIRLTVIGEITENIAGERIQITGRYNRKELPRLLKKHKIDIIFVPSICPETFSFTSEEAIRMGMPLAVFNLGAQAEKAANYEKGLVISSVNAEIALKEITDWWNTKTV